MNEQTFRQLFPNSSKDVLAANRGLLDTIPQPSLCDEPVATQGREDQNPTRCVVRITSFRCRPVDPDNLCPKFFVDALRFAGAIHDDREKDITLEVSQRRVAKKSQECTTIEIIYPS